MLCVAPGDQDEVLTHFAKQSYAAAEGPARDRPPAAGARIVQSYEKP